MSIPTQKLVDRVTAYWLTEYNNDGFRFDTKDLQILTAWKLITRIAILKGWLIRYGM